MRSQPLYLDNLLLDVTGNARALGSGKDVTLDVTALEESPVQGDMDVLRQLLMILLDNALKFTPPGATADAYPCPSPTRGQASRPNAYGTYSSDSIAAMRRTPARKGPVWASRSPVGSRACTMPRAQSTRRPAALRSWR